MFENLIDPSYLNHINLVLAIIVGLIVKDVATTFVSGLLFKMSSDFNQGDTVYIDGEYATIISTSIRRTIFKINDGRGETWRYVWNDRIKYLNIEKVIIPKEVMQLKKRRASDIDPDK